MLSITDGVAITAPPWLVAEEDNVAQLATMLSHATLNIHRSVSLLLAPSGLECVLAFQGNLSLHDAAISELLFELLKSQESIEKARGDTCSKGCHPLWKSFKLKSSIQKGLKGNLLCSVQ